MTQIKRLIPPTYVKDVLSGTWQFNTIAVNVNAVFIFPVNVGGLTYGSDFITGLKADKLYRVRYGSSLNGTSGVACVNLFELQKNEFMSARTQFFGPIVVTDKTPVPLNQQTFLATGLEKLTLRITPYPSSSLTLRHAYSFIEVLEI